MLKCCIYPTLAFTKDNISRSYTSYLPVAFLHLSFTKSYLLFFYLSSCHTYCLNSPPYPICLSCNPTLPHNNKLVILPILSHTGPCMRTGRTHKRLGVHAKKHILGHRCSKKMSCYCPSTQTHTGHKCRVLVLAGNRMLLGWDVICDDESCGVR